MFVKSAFATPSGEDRVLKMHEFADLILGRKQAIEIEGGYQVTKGVLLSSAGGILPDSASREFMQEVENGSVVLQNINFMKGLSRAHHNLDHLSAASRQTKLVVPGTEVTAGTVTPRQRQLTPVSTILALPIGYDWIALNADERDAMAVLRPYLADLFQADFVDMMFNGTGASTGFLSINKGFVQHIVDNTESDVNTLTETLTTFLGSAGILAKLRAKLGTQYRKDVGVYMSVDEADTVFEELSARATTLGDSMIMGPNAYKWHDYRIIGVPTHANDKIIMGPRSNFCAGLWGADFRIDIVDKPLASCIWISVQCMSDYNYAVGAATAYGITS